MPEISKEKLEWYENAMCVLEGYSGGDVRWRQRRLKALEPIYTLLVSDEELRDLGITGPGPIAIGRRLISRAFRNAAEWFENDNRNVAAATQLRKWADGETS